MSSKGERYVHFEIANMDRWDEYIAVFYNSPLYDRYFKGTDALQKLLEKAIKDGNVVSAETSSGEIVGVMVYERKGMFAELPYLALLGVKDGYRGQAIGSRLLDVYVNICRKTGVNKCFICVSHFNPRAWALYQRKGFQPVVLIPDLIRPGINEWLLMKQL